MTTRRRWGAVRPGFVRARACAGLSFLLLLFALPGTGLAAVAPGPAPAGVHLVSSDRSGVVLDVDLASPEFVPVTAPNGAFVRLGLEGYGSDARPGHPLLPVASLWLAVPEGATVTLEASGEGERLYDGLRLLPQQELARAAAGEEASAIPAQGPLARPLALDRDAYARPGFGPEAVATLDAIAHLRAQRVARVTLRPAAYDPRSGRVRVWSRLRVRLAFGGEAPTPAPAASTSLVPPPAEGGFEAVYRGALLNYESARAWRADLGAQSLRRRGLQPNARPASPGALLGGARQDFSASPNWVKLTVPSKGIYRVDPSDLALAGANLSTLDPRTLRIFVKPGVPLLAENVAPSGWLSEVAISVVGEGDGTFDPTDYLLFAGQGVSGWKDDYGVPGSDDGWLNHPYETKNSYFLTWGGGFVDAPRRWDARNAAPELPAAYETPHFPARAHFESDFFYFPDLQEGGIYHAQVGTFWEKWTWLTIADNAGTIQLSSNLPGAVESEPARFRARLWGNSREPFATFGIRDHYLNVSVNDVPFAERAFYGFVRQDYDTTFLGIRETGNRVAIFNRRVVDPQVPNRLDQSSLFWYEFEFARRLQPVANQLDFRSPDTTGAVGYGLGPFTSTAGLTLLDTSDPLAPVRLTGHVERDTTGGLAVYFHDDVTAPRHYLAFTSANVLRPEAIQRVAIDDLVAPSNGADYVVITYDGFTDPARTLANFRAAHLPGVANPRTRVVRMSDIYAWYSGGRTDPVAIRNFLYAAVKQVGWSPAPTTVCLLGDASYDFKNILRVAPAGQPPALVPAYVNGYQTRQFMTDDWLVDLDLGVPEPYPGTPGPGVPDSSQYDLPDLMVGRLPAANLAEATFLVDGKVIPYEADPVWGEWRARGLLLADDISQGLDSQGQPIPDPLLTEHMEEMELLSHGLVPDVVEQRKIYMVEYPFGSGSEKPAVNRDVQATVDEGVVFWNYIGHGNPFKMADENAFILSDVGSLTNLDKPSFVVAASCDLGKFDDPTKTGLGEALLKSTTGGAIATFSASDIAFAFANASLSRQLFAHLFTETPEGFTTPLGAAVLAAKLRQFSGSVNDLKYILMGDPAQTLALPKHDVRMTLSDDETGAPLDSLRRGRRVRVRGEVHGSHDPNVNALLSGYDGIVSLLVTDAPPRDSIRVSVFNTFHVYYNTDPGTVFRGDLPVRDGIFDAVFVMPLESIPGDGGKVRAYVSGGPQDAGGAVVAGVAPGSPAVVDSVGPTIALAFTSGTSTVAPDATLRILVRDENGVLLTGHTLPNALYLTIDGTTRYDLTKDFRYDPGSYQQGVIEFRLPNLEEGPHTILVSAADNYAQGVLARRNRSTASIDFEVEAAGAFTLGRAYNFPNPFTPDRGTTFVITGLNEEARVLIKIHTVSGGLVRTLEADAAPGQTQVHWDGADARGDRVANGAYTYQVEAEGRTSGRVVRFRGALAALR
jgi:hypothetical protein